MVNLSTVPHQHPSVTQLQKDEAYHICEDDICEYVGW